MAEDEEGKKESKAGSAGQNIGDIAKSARNLREKIGTGGAGSTAEASAGAAPAAGEAGAAAGGPAAVGTGAAGLGVGEAGATTGIAASGTVATAASGPAALATAAATAAAVAWSLLKKSASKIPAISIIAVCSVVFVIVIALVVIFAPILGLLGGGGFASASEILKVTKTPNPSHITKGHLGDTAKVQYSFSIQNKSSTTVDNVKLVDTFSGNHADQVGGAEGCNGDIGQITAGNTATFECAVTINDIYDDWVLYDTASVTGSQQSSQPSSATTSSNLDYYIPFRDTVVKVIDEENMKAGVADNTSWKNNFVNTNCDPGVSCWDYVKEESIKAGVNPAFTLAVWIEESGASSSYNHRDGMTGNFDCDPDTFDVPQTVDNLKQSLSCFLYSMYGNNPPAGAFKGASNYSPGDEEQSSEDQNQFERMLWDYCGSNTTTICEKNSFFLGALKGKYSQLVPAGNYGALTAASGGSGGTEATAVTVSAGASAAVIIGNVPFTDPSGWPTSGSVTQRPYCDGQPDNCPSHASLSAIDIGAGAGTPVYATQSGIDTSGNAPLEDYNSNGWISKVDANGNVIMDEEDLATCRSNAAAQGNYYGCTGNYVAIKGANYTTIYMHLQSINTACVSQGGSGLVVQGALIGFVDSTGNSTGNHLHYEIRQNNGSEVPLSSLSSVMPNWTVSSVEASYSGEGCGQ